MIVDFSQEDIIDRMTIMYFLTQAWEVDDYEAL